MNDDYQLQRTRKPLSPRELETLRRACWLASQWELSLAECVTDTAHERRLRAASKRYLKLKEKLAVSK